MGMRKWLQAGVVCALALLLLPGCSGNGGNDTSKSGEGSVGTNMSEDDKIKKAVQDKLNADPDLKEVKFEVKGGQVELTGNVKSIAAHDKVEADVKEAIKSFSSVSAGVLNNTTVEEKGDT